MDLQEKRQLDLARQVGKVKARARPWRSIIALALAIVAALASWSAGRPVSSSPLPTSEPLAGQIANRAGAAAFGILAIVAVIGFSGKARDVLKPVIGSSHAAVVRYTLVLAGGIVVLVLALKLVRLPVGQLLVGGALTTILIGIAAQQSLANVFAGIVLLLSRPFVVGDDILLRSGALSGIIEGTVTEIGITYLRLETAEGMLNVPNAQVLAAASGLARPPATAGTAPPDGPPSGPA